MLRRAIVMRMTCPPRNVCHVSSFHTDNKKTGHNNKTSPRLAFASALGVLKIPRVINSVISGFTACVFAFVSVRKKEEKLKKKKKERTNDRQTERRPSVWEVGRIFQDGNCTFTLANKVFTGRTLK